MPMYRATSEQPPLVQRAQLLAQQLQFTSSSLPEVGRLLYLLTSHAAAGRIGEIGAGCGVGAAWIVSALHPGGSFVTIDIDLQRVRAVQSLFAGYPNVQVLHGDWRQLLAFGPFDLLFADGGKAKEQDPAAMLSAVRPGGFIVLDDLTPEELWPPKWHGQPDPVRDFWLNDSRIVATELRVTAAHAVIMATRVQ